MLEEENKIENFYVRQCAAYHVNAIDENGSLLDFHPLAFAIKANANNTPNLNQAMYGPDAEGFFAVLVVLRLIRKLLQTAAGMRQHRGAIALNNMGAVLLEQKAFRQAVQTLKDSLHVIKRLLEDTDPLMDGYETEVEVDQMIRRAVGRCAGAQSRPKPSASTTTTCHVVLDDDDLPSLRDVILQEEQEMAAGRSLCAPACPIRMECNSKKRQG